MSRSAGGRTIVHVDMDAFFVSVELRRRPELRGKPVVVGGTGDRGVVAAASYEARRFGIHSAMASSKARRLCPDAVFLKGDMALYEQVSGQVHAIFEAFTPLVEPIALDEAFLDVTGSIRLFGDGPAIGRAIRARVLDELQLTCSVGIAPSKLVAKLASEAAKPVSSPTGVRPGRLVVEVRPDEQLAFLHAHPVRALWGVGPATFERLQRLGVSTIGDLADLSEQTLVASLGRSAGQHLHQLSQGIDDRDVVVARALKSVGHEQTFARDLYEPAELELEIVRMADAVASRLRAQELAARTVNLKVRYGTFVTITRAQTVPAPVDTAPAIAHAAQGLLAQLDVSAGVRLLGVSVSNLTHHAPRQLSLEVGDGATTTAREWEEASSAIDEIRSRFGDRAIGPASLVSGSEGRRELRIVRRGAQQWGPDQPGGPDQPSGQDSSRRR